MASRVHQKGSPRGEFVYDFDEVLKFHTYITWLCIMIFIQQLRILICDIKLITDYLCISLPNSRFLYMQMHLFLNSHSFLLPVLNQITCQIFATNIISMLSNREHSQYSVSRTLCHVSICLVYEDYIFDDFPLKYVLRNKTTHYI